MEFADRENIAPLSEDLFWAIIMACPKNGTILELGSGITTGEMAKYRNIISIEHNPQWMNKYNRPENYRFVVFDESMRFYKRDALAEAVAGVRYDVLLIDGPDTETRMDEFVKVMHLFTTAVPWFVDDWVYPNYQNGIRILKDRAQGHVVHFSSSPKQWGVIL